MTFEWWVLTAVANGFMVTIYGAIFVLMARAALSGRQLTTNPILTATAAVFLTCTIGHGVHLVHTLEPLVLPGGDIHAAAAAARAAFSDPRLVAWDVFTAGTAIWYWTLRSRFAFIYRGAALCEDMEKRQAEAMRINDDVVVGLQRAQVALDAGQPDEGIRALDETLASSRRIITHLLGQAGTETALGPGDLRRASSAGGHP